MVCLGVQRAGPRGVQNDNDAIKSLARYHDSSSGKWRTACPIDQGSRSNDQRSVGSYDSFNLDAELCRVNGISSLRLSTFLPCKSESNCSLLRDEKGVYAYDHAIRQMCPDVLAASKRKGSFLPQADAYRFDPADRAATTT